jgi:hypothetical protein
VAGAPPMSDAGASVEHLFGTAQALP